MNGILNTVMILMRGLFFMSLDLIFDWKHYVDADYEAAKWEFEYEINQKSKKLNRTESDDEEKI